MIEITDCTWRPELVDKAVEFFWGCWGKETNFHFYQDCIRHSVDPLKALPKFYLALEDEKELAPMPF
jgi:hypothetical protein